MLALGCLARIPAMAADRYVRHATWVDTVCSAREALRDSGLSRGDQAKSRLEIVRRIQADFPVVSDWFVQDSDRNPAFCLDAANPLDTLRQPIEKAIEGAGSSGAGLRADLDRLAGATGPDADRSWLDLYFRACEARRAYRLQTVLAAAPRVIFAKRRTVRPSFFAYTEGQSDAQNERHFRPGSELCVFEMEGLHAKVRTLVADPTGVIRDPAVSWDGQRVVFAWKKALDDDDYHLYEVTAASGECRQITSGAGFADYEPAFLPNGDLIFSSTRCVQTVDCWWTEVSNLYTCGPDGRFLRRLTFDQVHAIFPQVMDDGRVIYTRWDYNDRGQIFPQPLFQMAADGTGQTEFYGNNSWFPTTIAHARGIPGTEKVLAILCGHHSAQAGKLAIIDPALGRQENSGVQLVAPVRPTPAERIDAYGQDGELWQYPYPLNEREYLVTYAPLGWDQPERFQGDAAFGIYWMDVDGNRELLVSDPRMPCSQPVPLAPRACPPVRPSMVDHTRTHGVFYLQDIYAGPGLAGVERGSIKKLRVVALDFRAAGVGNNGSAGPGGGAMISTPISIGNGSWDVKVVLGEAEVYEDGSAMFSVPARTPVYFQALDKRGYAVQTMRSWSTLQPGETFACIGCHEHKSQVPATTGYGLSLAMTAGVKDLQPFHGPARGFSFLKEVQPILDRHCTRCHNDRSPVEALAQGKRRPPLRENRSEPPPLAGTADSQERAFSLLGQMTEDPSAKRHWTDSYLLLTDALPDHSEDGAGSFRGNPENELVTWIGSQSVPEMLPPGQAGAITSGLMNLLEQGHKGVELSRAEMETIACWIDLLVPYCGDYLEANAWNDEELAKYQRYANKRRKMTELESENLRQLVMERQRFAPDKVAH